MFRRPYLPPSWKVLFPHYCQCDISIPWPWKYYKGHLIFHCRLSMSLDIHIFVFWRPYWPPSWIVLFPHYCQCDSSIPWPWNYYNWDFICHCSLCMSLDIHFFVFRRPYWPPSWKVLFPHYSQCDSSIPWPWKYSNRHLICHSSLPVCWDITYFFWVENYPTSASASWIGASASEG